MSHEELDGLLGKMPDIAEAVNLFKFEAVQQAAFAALIAAAQNETRPTNPTDTIPTRRDPLTKPSDSPASKARKKSSDGRTSWTFKKETDLRPNGKKVFADFIAEKKPTSNEDKYAAVVYYLAEIVGQPSISIDDIGSFFSLRAIVEGVERLGVWLKKSK